MRRVGFIATLVAGVGLLGASLHGMTDVDHTLKVAAAQQSAPQTELVREQTGKRDCDREREHLREHRHPEV